MRIYLSGPITGVKDYRRNFREAAGSVASRGHTVFNPADLFGGMTLKEIMRWDLLCLTDCDAVCMLPGWSNSGGAKIEHDLAVYLGMEIYYNLDQIPDESEAEI